MPLVRKASKAEVAYGPAKATSPENCGVCRHFERPDACALVAGTINHRDWCRLFEARRKAA